MGREPRPIVLAFLCLRLAGSNPDNEELGNRRHGENLGDRWKREHRELNVLPRRTCARGDFLAYGVAVQRFSGSYLWNRHIFRRFSVIGARFTLTIIAGHPSRRREQSAVTLSPDG